MEPLPHHDLRRAILRDELRLIDERSRRTFPTNEHEHRLRARAATLTTRLLHELSRREPLSTALDPYPLPDHD